MGRFDPRCCIRTELKHLIHVEKFDLIIVVDLYVVICVGRVKAGCVLADAYRCMPDAQGCTRMHTDEYLALP